MTDINCTACCGLYCKDCIPANRALYETAGKLESLLSDLNFDKYAAYKAGGNTAFAGYPTFAAVLQAIKGLECRKVCGDGGGKPGCAVRKCAKEKNFAGCWECGAFRECGLLAPLKANHEDLEHNLAMIAEHGADDWAPKRGRHYRWDEVPRKS